MPQWSASTQMDLACGDLHEDGYSLEMVYSVILTHSSGKRLAYLGPAPHDTQADCRRLVARINRYIADHPRYEPKERYWNETNPVYGSDYYVESGEEQNWLLQERRMDQEGYVDKRLAYLNPR